MASDDVWAVGWKADAAIGYEALIMHWDGTTWELASGLDQQDSPNTYGIYLEDVSAASADEVWAVGRDYVSSSDTLTVIMRWDGSNWTQITSPNPSLTINRLWAVAAVGEGEAWAVGTYYHSGTGYLTLTERYGPPCGTPTSTPTQGAATETPTAVLGTSTATVGVTGTITVTITIPVGTSTRTSTSVPPSATAAASATVCPGVTIAGALTLDDPTQAGRLTTLLESSTCLDPRGCPGVLDIVPRHYDAYAFVNTSSSTACFTVDVTAACLENVLIHSSAYLDSFDPDNLCTHYLADVGPGLLTNSQYSFEVPAGARFVVVVNELAPNLLCPNYTVTITGPACLAPAPTGTPTATATITAIPTVGACELHFSDVEPGSTFFDQIMCLSCMGFTNGYSDGSFRPNYQITRGQLAKVVSNTAGITQPQTPTNQSFEDVPVGSTFYMYIERMAASGIIGGYACGGEGEPCGPTNRPYFRPAANATRGQISKIVSNAAGLTDTPTEQSFEDVPSSHTFYVWIERLAMHDMMSGYACGGAGEPCGSTSRPYYRPAMNATRGQTSKIVANGFYPDCGATARR